MESLLMLQIDLDENTSEEFQFKACEFIFISQPNVATF